MNWLDERMAERELARKRKREAWSAMLAALNLALEYVEHDVEEWTRDGEMLESERSVHARKLRDVLNAAKAKAEGK